MADESGVNIRRSESPSSADAELVTVRGKRIKVSDEEFAIMLEKAGGFRSRVAKQLGVSSSAISHRIRRSPYLQEQCRTIEETVLDLAEAGLIKAAQNGEPWAITFILKCKGRRRGWVERQDVVFGGESDAPPPPFVIELHDPAFIEAERKRQADELANTIDAMATDVLLGETKPDDVEEIKAADVVVVNNDVDGVGLSVDAQERSVSAPETEVEKTTVPVSKPAENADIAPPQKPPKRPLRPSEVAALRKKQAENGQSKNTPPKPVNGRFVSIPAAFPKR